MWGASPAKVYAAGAGGHLLMGCDELCEDLGQHQKHLEVVEGMIDICAAYPEWCTDEMLARYDADIHDTQQAIEDAEHVCKGRSPRCPCCRGDLIV